MKFANFVVNILIILDLFNNVVNYFEYIQVNRNYNLIIKLIC